MLNWLHTAYFELLKHRGTMHHALLMYGTSKVGQFELAQYVAQALLCQTPTEQGGFCNNCQSCHLFKQHSHPDFRLVLPDHLAAQNNLETDDSKKDDSKKSLSQEIRLDNLAGLTHFVYTSPHQAICRVVIVYPADRLNIFAANALLKLLEEPSADTYFLLVADQIDEVLPTIKSRSRYHPVKAPSAEEGIAWLMQQAQISQTKAMELWQLSGGAPFLALDFANQDFNYAQFGYYLKHEPSQLSVLGLPGFCQLLQRWLYDVVLLKLTGSAHFFTNCAIMRNYCAISSLNELLSRQEQIKKYLRYGNHPLHPQLQMEKIIHDLHLV
jgi:DNA polymerase-3 subunit delta'